MKDRLIDCLCSAPLGSKTFQEQYYKSTITKIADYLLANGVIVPSCKVGDKLYKPWKDKKIGGTICYQVNIAEVGKTVFLTKEEAEQALKGGAE